MSRAAAAPRTLPRGRTVPARRSAGRSAYPEDGTACLLRGLSKTFCKADSTDSAPVRAAGCYSCR